MLSYSRAVSKLLTEREGIRKEAKALALHCCNGHFSKIDAFWASLEKRGGIVIPGAALIRATINVGAGTHLVFVGTEAEVLERLEAIRVPVKMPVPESVAVKMITLRIVKILKGIGAHNKYEREREQTARVQLASPNPPAWVQPYTAQLLPDLQLSDLPDCIRYSRMGNSGGGKAILELRRLWTRLEVTPAAIEAAWKVATIHQVMGA